MTLLDRLLRRPDPAPEPAAPARPRRDRHAGRPEAIVLESLGQKVLHGWLQNRYQTLLPLTLNLRSLDLAQRALVIRLVAAAMEAGGRGCDLDLAQGALARIGAGERERRMLAESFGKPAEAALFDAILAARIGTHAYGAALLAVDQRDPASARYLAYLAARLALPEDAVASLHRRYRP
ncbi:DUF533 domain-containing protein [Methylobacterium organophilum]|uniref:DUF533 domain-containing protein n=1 Tax=Methylobacterium organophilum TaxID=410 RepID=UPI001F130935|nr:DUF533 domain-containing protein [Methylobacterium organophilum]UMY18520.1 DUF533 domain-containing protein [Methylobacterium organophilum]